MRAIFISYRRDDAEGQAGRLFKDLAQQFGQDSVFMDVADIEPGRDFRRVIDEQVASCGVLLAVIGRNWLDAKDESGRRRLEDPGDFVRLETATALKREIPVVPVLVQGARMPRADQLPQDLGDLAFRNAVELTHARWDSDVQLLLKALRPYVGPDRADAGATESTARPAQRTAAAGAGRDIGESAPARRAPWAAIAAGAALLALAAGGYVAFDRSQQAAREDAIARQQRAEEEARAAAEKKRIEQTEAERIARGQAAEVERRRREEAARAAAATKSEPAQPQSVRFEGSITTNDPCRSATVTARGTTTLTIERSGSEVTVRSEFRGSGAGYAVGYRGAKVFPERAPSYDVPISGQWKADTGAVFTSRGVDRILTDATGAPSGDKIQSLENSCTPAAAGTSSPRSARYDGVITTKDPCSGRSVTARGTTTLTIEDIAAGVVVRQRFTGTGDGYSASYSGTGSFDRRAASYDIRIAGEWRASAGTRFLSRGMDRISANPAGSPTGDQIQTLSNQCAR